MVTHDTECPYGDQVSLNYSKFKLSMLIDIDVIDFHVLAPLILLRFLDDRTNVRYYVNAIIATVLG